MSATKQEKPDITPASPDGSQLEGGDEPVKKHEALDDDPVFTLAEQRKIIHRVDWRLIIPCGLMYCMFDCTRTPSPFQHHTGLTEAP